MNNSKYSPEEILQILNDFYNYQAVFDPEVGSGESLSFDTTISEWKSLCDLKEPKVLAEYYSELFGLTNSYSDLQEVLSNKNKLKGFCDYISEYAVKQNISSIKIMGETCMTASIFKTLMTNLKLRGIETQNIRPSSEFRPLFYEHGAVFLEEVNKLAPGSLSKFEYRENWIVKLGLSIIVLSVLSIFIVSMIWHFHWTLMIALISGIIISIIGNKFKPAKENIGGYDTMRELIVGMQYRIEKAI